MPERITLTEKRVRDLPLPKTGEARVYDDDQPGLVLRLRPDSRRWYCSRWAVGKQHNVALGSWPAISVEVARGLAREALTKLVHGVDPNAEKKAARAQARGGKVPLRDVLDHVLARMATLGRAARHTAERARIGETLIAAGLKDLADPRACAIAEKWIREQTCSDLTRHRYGMHVRAIGRAAAKKWDDLPRDPFRALEAGSGAIPPPAMFTLPELFRLASDEALATEWGRLFYFLLASGCRLREGFFARWERVNLEARTFAVLPPTDMEKEQGEAVKRGKARTVSLPAELTAVMAEWPRLGDFVFNSACRSQGSGTTEAFRAHLLKLKIPVDGRHIHTLRHSHIALSVACGVPDMHLRLSVGHGGAVMTAHYASAAMLWRAKLAPWQGVFRLRDPAEAARIVAALGGTAAGPGVANRTHATTNVHTA